MDMIFSKKPDKTFWKNMTFEQKFSNFKQKTLTDSNSGSVVHKTKALNH